MKRVIVAILTLILAAQLPFGALKYATSEWLNSVDYGLKWTTLMMSGYPGAPEPVQDIPEGDVTMTVTLASMPVFEEMELQVDVEVQKELFQVHLQEKFQKQTIKILKRQQKLLREHRLIKTGRVNLIQL